MKKDFLFVLCLPFIFFSCTKSSSGGCKYAVSTVKAPVNEIDAIRSYLHDIHDSTAIEDTASGLFYHITSTGTGSSPGLCSNIIVQYIGKLTTSNDPFDKNTAGASFILGNLTLGWQRGLPLIHAGGSIDLFVPPSLGYGSTGSGTNIPPNAILIFSINLLAVQ